MMRNAYIALIVTVLIVAAFFAAALLTGCDYVLAPIPFCGLIPFVWADYKDGLLR